MKITPRIIKINNHRALITETLDGDYPDMWISTSVSEVDRLTIVNCQESSLDYIGQFPKVTHLTVNNSTALKTIDLSLFPNLKVVSIKNVPNLMAINLTDGCTKLTTLNVTKFSNCLLLPGIEDLKVLNCVGFSCGGTVPLKLLPTTVRELTCINVALAELPSKDTCSNITTLTLRDCPLTEVPNWLEWASLKSLNLVDMTQEVINGTSSKWNRSINRVVVSRGMTLPKVEAELQMTGKSYRMIVWA
jgi:LysM repeat protein